jgi:chorismate mutase / prephenate dehydratase
MTMQDEAVQALETLRTALDQVDGEIVQMLGKRFELVSKVGATKASHGIAVRSPEREREVIEKAECSARRLGVPVPLVRRVFQEVIAQSFARQAPVLGNVKPPSELRLAYQGAPYSYSHIAAEQFLQSQGRAGTLASSHSFQQAVNELHSGAVDLAFLPVENTIVGAVPSVHSLLRDEELFIVGEHVLKIEHCLAAPAEVELGSIRRVLSQRHAFEQCSRFLHELPQAELVPHFDTAGSMRLVAESADPAQAAIGSVEAALAYGLKVLAGGIQNRDENFTRFVALSQRPVQPPQGVPAKTSLMLSVRQEMGALCRSLQIFADAGLSLSRLEAQPRPGRPWEYLFFADVEGNMHDAPVAQALEALCENVLYVKLLGSYPAMASAAFPQSAKVQLLPEPSVQKAAEPCKPRAARRSKNYKLVDRAWRAEDTLVRVGDLFIGGDSFVVMAGPCAVESEEQLMTVARHVRDAGAHILRGGVFKPRTSPYSFQGLGLEGLELMSRAGRAFGLPIVTEVMSPAQVRPVAELADILQIGSRSMQNFPLLREVGKVDRPVLLKRGLSSTIEEWLAAAEYIVSQGNAQVILCERGIRTFEGATRNTLDLSAVVVLKERTHLPIIVDPSHGTGNRAYVAPMAWAARACGAHGLLVEVHPEPDKALSDGDQSLDLPGLSTLMQGLGRIGSGVLAPGPARPEAASAEPELLAVQA